jgi:Secretion system C-terminal sorting domain
LVGYHYDYIYSSYKIDLFKSTNKGGSWSKLSTGSSVIDYPTSIIFSGNKLLMCGETSAGNFYVSVSNNFGQSWTTSNTGIPTNYRLYDFVVASNGFVFIASAIYNGFGVYLPRLLKSTNSGASWVDVPMSGLSTNFKPTGLFIDSQGKMYLSGAGITTNWMHTSSNNGSTWTLSNTGIPTTYRVYEMARGNGQEVFASCLTLNNNSTYDQKIIKTTNSGANWSLVAASGFDPIGVEGNALVNSGGNLLLMGSGPDYVYKKALPAAPVVLTSTVTDIHDVTASGVGQLTSNGGVTPVSIGFCWNTAPNPSISNFTVDAGTGSGTFVATISGLMPLTTYYVKAFATNSVGISYGSEISFITSVASGIKSFDQKTESILYPVPSSDFVYLDVHIKKASYTIYDMAGKLVLTGVIEEGKNMIDIRSLPQGGYFLQVENGEKQKILKQ